MPSFPFHVIHSIDISLCLTEMSENQIEKKSLLSFSLVFFLFPEKEFEYRLSGTMHRDSRVEEMDGQKLWAHFEEMRKKGEDLLVASSPWPILSIKINKYAGVMLGLRISLLFHPYSSFLKSSASHSALRSSFGASCCLRKRILKAKTRRLGAR